MLPDARTPRLPVPGFAQLSLTTKVVSAATWCNLRWRQFASRKDLFYVSASARFTPAHGKVSCLYLAPTERTCFLELYGDKFSGDRENGRMPRMEAVDFLERTFLEVNAPDLLLADLVKGEAIEAIHLDQGTIYAADVEYPRYFAQAIFDHPTKVDGILYESRHTKEHCAVVWCARAPNLANVPFVSTGELALRTTLHGGTASLFGQEVQVAS